MMKENEYSFGYLIEEYDLRINITNIHAFCNHWNKPNLFVAGMVWAFLEYKEHLEAKDKLWKVFGRDILGTW